MTVAAAEVGPAAICPADPPDHDFYRFTVPPGTSSVSVSITLAGGPSGDLDLRITDETGATTLGQSRGFEDVERIICPGTSPACPVLNPGDYLFEVFPATAAAVNRYEIELAFTPI